MKPIYFWNVNWTIFKVEDIILIQDCYDCRLFTHTIYNTELIISIFIFQVLEMAGDL